MTRHRSVKRIFSFSSGTLKRLGICGAVTRSVRDGAAGLLDLRPGGGGHRHAFHGESALHLPHPEQLDGPVRSAHEPGAEQRVGRHLDAFGEPLEVAYVHDLGRLLEGVRKAALGDAADERHLAALEAGTRLTPAAGRLTLPASAGRLPDPRARAA